MINEEANTSDRSSEFCPIQAFFPLIRPILDYKQKTPLMQGFSSIKVRRGRDSNPPRGYKPLTHLAGDITSIKY